MTKPITPPPPPTDKNGEKKLPPLPPDPEGLFMELPVSSELTVSAAAELHAKGQDVVGRGATGGHEGHIAPTIVKQLNPSAKPFISKPSGGENKG